ncbi:MAG: hypothetical protein PHO02_07240 [Candidatus Nanoarchaeia archaeon]|nr:hypothetical protein [Candidatus Nanoarchaeia archaeon]
MALDEDIKDIKEALNKKPGYLMLVFLVSSFAILGERINKNNTNEILNAINTSHQVQTANIIEGSAPEKFYVIDGQRTYLEIDGKPVAEYLKERQ